MIDDKLYDMAVPETAFRYNELATWADEFIRAVMRRTKVPFRLVIENHPNIFLNAHGDRILVAYETAELNLKLPSPK